MTTTDLAEFGSRERQMAEELLRAWRLQGLPKDFCDDEVQVMMNTNSGCVFLTNSDYQVAMMNGDYLESFYTLHYNGEEGFLEDFDDYKEDDLHREDWEQLQQIRRDNNYDEI